MEKKGERKIEKEGEENRKQRMWQLLPMYTALLYVERFIESIRRNM